MREIVQVDGGLHYVAPRRPAGAEHLLEILHDSLGLLDDSPRHDLSRHRVESNLAGRKEKAIRYDSL